jgi:hypothetical protein
MMIDDPELLGLAESIDTILLDACVKHRIGFEVITAIVLARIVAISQHLNSESDTGRLLSLAQSSIMETSNHTIQ